MPRLRFLQILLGDEPPLTPDSRFYQRLLAMDHDEARQVLENYLEGKTLEELYDSVLIPAWAWRRKTAIKIAWKMRTRNSSAQSTRELIDEFWSRAARNRLRWRKTGGGRRGDSRFAAGNEVLQSAVFAGPDEADEMVGSCWRRSLEIAGHRAQCVPLGSATEMLAQVKEETGCGVLSALPPFAIPACAHALREATRAGCGN